MEVDLVAGVFSPGGAILGVTSVTGRHKNRGVLTTVARLSRMGRMNRRMKDGKMIPQRQRAIWISVVSVVPLLTLQRSLPLPTLHFRSLTVAALTLRRSDAPFPLLRPRPRLQNAQVAPGWGWILKSATWRS